jgi:hypothetical protein
MGHLQRRACLQRTHYRRVRSTTKAAVQCGTSTWIIYTTEVGLADMARRRARKQKQGLSVYSVYIHSFFAITYTAPPRPAPQAPRMRSATIYKAAALGESLCRLTRAASLCGKPIDPPRYRCHRATPREI